MSNQTDLGVFPVPASTVDVALMTLTGGCLGVVLVRREAAPFKDSLALPGGYVHVDGDENLDATAARVLAAKAGITAPYLEQLCTFSGRNRDPRGWSISHAYYAVVPPENVATHLAKGARIVAVDGIERLPFDHNEIVDKAVERVRGKAVYSSLPTFLLPDSFTMQEVHEVYQRVMGAELDRQTFRRRIESLGFIEPIEGEMRQGSHRPAQLYRRVGSGLRLSDASLRS
jgi:8-oxo-dGTP diphosphatase